MNRLLLLGLLVLMPSLAGADAPPLETVKHVDLPRYLGKWYEIARFPAPFQKDCAAAQATYTARENGDISILNECRDKTLTGDWRRANGKAWVVDTESNAKLKVQFFWPFRGDYWVIELGKDYEYSVVSEPRRRYLWILSRTRQLPEATYSGILQRLTERGFDLTPLTKTPQPVEP